jgi:DNA invertase Pin-like site-specific DNA recombinase/chorismate mutase
MQAVIYARVSSREQEQEGYSIQAHLKLLHAYATKNGFEIVREFIDIETAKTTGRKEFGEMVKFIGKSMNCRTILVEKTDRLYRNFEDSVRLEKLDIEIHFVKTGNILSKNAKAQTKFMHGIEVVSAKYYSDNLREEVIKGMREKAEQGIYPGRAPFGYRNNRLTRTIEVHPENSEIVKRIFELYATAKFSLITLRKQIRMEFGKTMARSYFHTILTNQAYVGTFEWAHVKYQGSHVKLIAPQLFETVQAVMQGHHKGKYSKHDIAFRGMMTCAHDNLTVTAELKKGKYVYYRCSGYHGKCELPRFREEQISEKLGEVLKGIHIPDAVLARISSALEHDQERIQKDADAKHEKLAQRLEAIRNRMSQAYADKLDGKIAEDFWQRQMSQWQAEEQQIKLSMEALKEPKADRVLNAQRTLELANVAYSLYLTQKPAEQAELLRKVLLNCSIDAVSVTPTYRKPFDMIFERAKRKEWSGREDLNLRPPGPEL